MNEGKYGIISIIVFVFVIYTTLIRTWVATSNYARWYNCGIIVSKMTILTDTGDGEYKRLSDKFEYKKCRYDGEKATNDYVLSM